MCTRWGERERDGERETEREIQKERELKRERQTTEEGANPDLYAKKKYLSLLVKDLSTLCMLIHTDPVLQNHVINNGCSGTSCLCLGLAIKH